MLKNSLFKKLLLNPGLSYNVDEDGNDPNSGDNSQIIEALPGNEGVSGSSIRGVSKLRARNAHQLADTDERYQGKTVKRAELEDTEPLHEDYDPSLAKYFLIEEEDDEDHEKKDEKDNENEEDEETDEIEEVDEEVDEEEEVEETSTNDFDCNGLQNDFERFADDDFGEDDENDDSDNDDSDDDDGGGAGDSDTGYDEASDSQANSAEDSNKEDEDVSGDEDSGVMRVAGQDDLSEEQQKAKSVVKQLTLYEKLFAARINMQKIMRGSLQLPQPPARQAFLQQEGAAAERFTGCIEVATTAAGELVQGLLVLQEALLNSNPESKCVLKGDSSSIVAKVPKRNAPVDDDDEEITSSEDESDEEHEAATHRKLGNAGSGQDGDWSDDDDDSQQKAEKRKRDATCDLTELEETLSKRHCAMRPYRNKVVAFWDERTRLLQAQSKVKDSKAGGGAFAAFDEGFGVMVKRLLADREKLLKRTQLRSTNRENLSVPIGSKEIVATQEVDADLDIPKAPSHSQYERYDSEIYDDTDFYTRYLDEIIKGQHRRGTSGLSTAQYLDITQKLRKKNKKVVDTRRSKGRKLKYDVISSLLQYLPSCGTTTMEDDAVEQVTMSLFGGRHAKPAASETAQR